MNVALGGLFAASTTREGQKSVNGYESTHSVSVLTAISDSIGCLDFEKTNNCKECNNNAAGTKKVEPTVEALVFWNPIVMERIISYVPLVKDRINIERCCRRMRDLSRRALYLKTDVDCTLLDMHFQTRKPEITVAFSGNELLVPVTVSAYRLSNSDGPTAQPVATIVRLEGFCRRFGKQINSLRIGSIHDIQRRMSYITDYELVLTWDLCQILSTLRNLKSLCIRNCLMTCQVLDEWSSDESLFMQQIQSFCFHGIWFDKSADCDRLMSILKYGVRRLHLSKCGTEILCQIADRLSHLGIKLDYIYLLLNVHSVNKEYFTRKALKRLSGVCKELRLCICLSTMNIDEEHLLLIKMLRFVAEFPKITVLELDVGIPDIKGFPYYEKFFRGLCNLPRLRTLRISSIALKNYQLPIWRQLVFSLLHLHTVTELAVRGIGGRLSSPDIQNLCEFLPKNLKILNLYLAKKFTGQHLRIIADRCESLEVLLILGANDIECEAVCYGVKKLWKLQCLALSRIDNISEKLVKLLCNKEETPALDALSFGRLNLAPFSPDMLETLSRRFHHVKVAQNFCCEERLNEGIETTHLYQSQRGFQRILDGLAFGECPGCEKDLTLFDDDS